MESAMARSEVKLLDYAPPARREKGGGYIMLFLGLVLLGVFSAIALEFLVDHRGLPLDKRAMARQDISGLSTAIAAFEVDTGRFPTSSEGLAASMTQPANSPGWQGPYLSKPASIDPWGSPYIYAYPGVHNPKTFDLYSKGPDAKPGTADDIGNW